MENHRRRQFIATAGITLTSSAISTGCATTRTQTNVLDDGEELTDFKRFTHSHNGKKYDVFASESDGPALILMHEINGLSPAVVEFGRYLVECGYHVYMPMFFGKPNDKSNGIGNIIRLCIRREMSLFAGEQSSQFTDWLRSLCRGVSKANSDSRIGVIGMCLTGGFVIPMMVEDSVIAAVSAQPAVPFLSGRSIDIDNEVIELAVERKDRVELMSLRYKGDSLSPPERHEVFSEIFCGDRKIKSCQGYRFEEFNGNGHSTLTSGANEAREKVLKFFNERLLQ